MERRPRHSFRFARCHERDNVFNPPSALIILLLIANKSQNLLHLLRVPLPLLRIRTTDTQSRCIDGISKTTDNRKGQHLSSRLDRPDRHWLTLMSVTTASHIQQQHPHSTGRVKRLPGHNYEYTCRLYRDSRTLHYYSHRRHLVPNNPNATIKASLLDLRANSSIHLLSDGTLSVPLYTVSKHKRPDALVTTTPQVYPISTHLAHAILSSQHIMTISFQVNRPHLKIYTTSNAHWSPSHKALSNYK